MNANKVGGQVKWGRGRGVEWSEGEPGVPGLQNSANNDDCEAKVIRVE